MANDMNSVCVVGRLTSDPRFEFKANGFAVLSFSIAVNRSRKQNGEWVDEVSFFDCVLFGKQAEALKMYMVKGKQVAVEGYLKQNRWTSQDGTKRSRVTIGCENVQLLGGRSEGHAPTAGDYGDGCEEYYGFDN